MHYKSLTECVYVSGHSHLVRQIEGRSPDAQVRTDLTHLGGLFMFLHKEENNLLE